MDEQFLTFKKFNDEGLAKELTALFDEYEIKYIIENEKALDNTFALNDELNQEFRVKISKSDFIKADELLLEVSKNQLDAVPADYYLFNFTDEELMEIIIKPDEWGKLDFVLAQKLLKERGKEINPEVVSVMRKQRIDELAKPEGGQQIWIIVGYIMAFLGGLLGIFIGYHLLTFKKTLPTGDRVYAYSLKDRNQGGYIMIVGILCFIAWIIFRIIS